MIETVKEQVRKLLDSGQIQGFLGLLEKNGHISPHLFTDPEELDRLNLGERDKPGDARYPLTKYLIKIARAHPDKKFGILVRGCDERALKTLYNYNQLNPGQVVPVGIACPEELARECECRQPYPEECVAGEKSEGCASVSVDRLDELELSERFDYWTEQYAKCIKCYGCRDVCPVCFCNECTLASEDLVQTKTFPTETPLFHLVRAAHMAGRCIDCGLCEQACPVGIPLRTLYKKIYNIMDEELDYQTGYSEEKSPLNAI
ncbi:MAG: 4Fe-4S dicluster domain-containing protein [Desulfohalobiaceae bacterium]|nr:4Fe-4S dicluster domain-containing protein [Desulfohalobiaceae bacterium]